jgi:hypothetical protein
MRCTLELSTANTTNSVQAAASLLLATGESPERDKESRTIPSSGWDSLAFGMIHDGYSAHLASEVMISRRCYQYICTDCPSQYTTAVQPVL